MNVFNSFCIYTTKVVQTWLTSWILLRKLFVNKVDYICRQLHHRANYKTARNLPPSKWFTFNNECTRSTPSPLTRLKSAHRGRHVLLAWWALHAFLEHFSLFNYRALFQLICRSLFTITNAKYTFNLSFLFSLFSFPFFSPFLFSPVSLCNAVKRREKRTLISWR